LKSPPHEGSAQRQMLAGAWLFFGWILMVAVSLELQLQPCARPSRAL
jgi:hypothetical protein